MCFKKASQYSALGNKFISLSTLEDLQKLPDINKNSNFLISQFIS
jgi:hypothetical protein